eukprot:scaffold125596_cov60-Phaeocystis_antarctica.AAC.2
MTARMSRPFCLASADPSSSCSAPPSASLTRVVAGGDHSLGKMPRTLESCCGKRVCCGKGECAATKSVRAKTVGSTGGTGTSRPMDAMGSAIIMRTRGTRGRRAERRGYVSNGRGLKRTTGPAKRNNREHRIRKNREILTEVGASPTLPAQAPPYRIAGALTRRRTWTQQAAARYSTRSSGAPQRACPRQTSRRATRSSRPVPAASRFPTRSAPAPHSPSCGLGYPRLWQTCRAEPAHPRPRCARAARRPRSCRSCMRAPTGRPCALATTIRSPPGMPRRFRWRLGTIYSRTSQRPAGAVRPYPE